MIDWTEEDTLKDLREFYSIHPMHEATRVPMSVVVALCDRVEELTAEVISFERSYNAAMRVVARTDAKNADLHAKLHGGYSEEE